MADRLGTWPFEIGLWVGKAATPNRMGEKGDNDQTTARARRRSPSRTTAGKPSPIPIETCPWCGTKFRPRLVPAHDAAPATGRRRRPADHPCAEPRRARSRASNPLPIVAVDEPLYRRLPCFVIATVDKFASLPWAGASGRAASARCRSVRRSTASTARASRTSAQQLAEAARCRPTSSSRTSCTSSRARSARWPGCTRRRSTRSARAAWTATTIRPKIVASTATVRRAERPDPGALRARRRRGLPAAGAGPPRLVLRRRRSRSTQTTARLYVGVAAQGRSLEGRAPAHLPARCSARRRRHWRRGRRREEPGRIRPIRT